ncbi:hypothetical protein LP422_14950 [Janibacter limosus]|uniref:LysM peptidoglycan-binding domain-containing protein n=1 Tax=Janibacter limosus TaxID=53458 RepID=UPI0035D653A1|nr:hypothetical protein LP422_14950 [Janibacter limosus]
MRHLQRTTRAFVAALCGVLLTTVPAVGAHRMALDGIATGGDPAAAVVGVAAPGATLIVGWLTLALLLSLLAQVPGRIGRWALHLRDRVTPAIVRRWAAVVIGASVTASVLPGTAVAAVRPSQVRVDALAPGWLPSAPESAHTPTPRTSLTAPTPRTSPGWSATTESGAPTTTESGPPTTTPAAPGWTPRRPGSRHRTDPSLLTGHHRADSGDEVVVRRGDSLWSITAAHLGPDATAAEIAQARPRWHEANADRIGPDPHLLLPGTRLSPPDHHHDPRATSATKGTR